MPDNNGIVSGSGDLYSFGYSYEDRYGPDDCIGKGSGYSAGRGCDNGSGWGSDDDKQNEVPNAK